MNHLDFTPTQADKLIGIPGLHLRGLHATGSIDALAAGHYVLTNKWIDILKGSRKRRAFPNARHYQNSGINWMIDTLMQHGACILGDEMGLGKSFQSIMLLRYAMRGRALIIAPGSVRETWRHELTKFLYPYGSVAVMYPGATDKAWEFAATAKVVVTSHDYRMIDRALVLAFNGEYPEYLVIDEAHKFRGRDNKRVDVLSESSALIPYKIALTGTPQWNSMKDWYSLLKILLPNRFGSRWDFDFRYAGAKRGQHGGLEYPRKDDAAITPKLLHTEELRGRLRYYMLARQKSDVAKDMPAMTVSIRWVDATKGATLALKKFQMGVRSKGSPWHEAVMATLPGKVDEVIALAAEAKRFVLTSWTNEGCADLHRMLNNEGTPCLLVTSKMSGIKRQALINEAATKRVGLVATTDLFAEGLNLQKVASVGILHALDVVPEKMRQLMGRLHRIDIVDPVTWFVVAMRDSIDKYIIDAGVFKLSSSDAVMGRKSELGAAMKSNDVNAAQTERDALAAIYAAMEAGTNEEDI